MGDGRAETERPRGAYDARYPLSRDWSGLVSRRGWVLFAAMSVIWGLPYLLIKVAVGGVSVPVLVLARVALGAALLIPFALRGKQFRAIKAVWPWLLLFAVVE